MLSIILVAMSGFLGVFSVIWALLARTGWGGNQRLPPQPSLSLAARINLGANNYDD